jgi:hypothetical protein
MVVFKNNLFGLSLHKEFIDSNILILNFYIDKSDHFENLDLNTNTLEIKINRHQSLIGKYFEKINIEELIAIN